MANDPSVPFRYENRLLSMLPGDVSERLRPHIEEIDLALKQPLYTANEPITQIYFPCTAVCSLVLRLDDDTLVEIATVGNEGMVGLPLFLGADRTPGRAVCQVAGAALRLDTDTFRAVLRVAPELQEVLGRYTLVLLTQAGQAAACNGLHALAERGARWLLEAHDRVGSDRFRLTQDFLAAMLGVRRPSVTLAAGMLQQAGLITYHRGEVTILDRAGLEAASCECYAAIRRETDRLLGGPDATPR